MIKDRKRRNVSILFMAVLLNIIVSGCGNTQKNADSLNAAPNAQEESLPETARDVQEENQHAGTAEEAYSVDSTAETAKNAQIDFAALKAENPDIFAWIYIPGTKIDYPVLQSEEADDFYESHNAYGEEDDSGAVYIELANLTNMCDFNTVLHGKTKSGDSGQFSDLYKFDNPDFFEEHELCYLYLDGNVLTYEIFAAYEREDTSLIRTYDFTYLSGCQQFLDDLYGERTMNQNLREGWDDLTPYHFLITLTTCREDTPGKQFIVIAALMEDAAGTIDRVVTE